MPTWHLFPSLSFFLPFFLDPSISISSKESFTLSPSLHKNPRGERERESSTFTTSIYYDSCCVACANYLIRTQSSLLVKSHRPRRIHRSRPLSYSLALFPSFSRKQKSGRTHPGRQTLPLSFTTTTTTTTTIAISSTLAKIPESLNWLLTSHYSY